jgi:hypothetical protein
VPSRTGKPHGTRPSYLVMAFLFPLAIRRGRPLRLPFLRFVIGRRGQAWKPAPTGLGQSHFWNITALPAGITMSYP